MTGSEHRLRRSRMADASRMGVRLISERIGALQSGTGAASDLVNLLCTRMPWEKVGLGKLFRIGRVWFS